MSDEEFIYGKFEEDRRGNTPAENIAADILLWRAKLNEKQPEEFKKSESFWKGKVLEFAKLYSSISKLNQRDRGPLLKQLREKLPSGLSTVSQRNFFTVLADYVMSSAPSADACVFFLGLLPKSTWNSEKQLMDGWVNLCGQSITDKTEAETAIQLWVLEFYNTGGNRKNREFLAKLFRERISADLNSENLTQGFADFFTKKSIDPSLASFFLPLLPIETRNSQNETIPMIIINRFGNEDIRPLMQGWLLAANEAKTNGGSDLETSPLSKTLNAETSKGNVLDYLQSLGRSGPSGIDSLLIEYGARRKRRGMTPLIETGSYRTLSTTDGAILTPSGSFREFRQNSNSQTGDSRRETSVVTDKSRPPSRSENNHYRTMSTSSNFGGYSGYGSNDSRPASSLSVRTVDLGTEGTMTGDLTPKLTPPQTEDTLTRSSSSFSTGSTGKGSPSRRDRLNKKKNKRLERMERTLTQVKIENKDEHRGQIPRSQSASVAGFNPDRNRTQSISQYRSSVSMLIPQAEAPEPDSPTPCCGFWKKSRPKPTIVPRDKPSIQNELENDEGVVTLYNKFHPGQ